MKIVMRFLIERVMLATCEHLLYLRMDPVLLLNQNNIFSQMIKIAETVATIIVHLRSTLIIYWSKLEIDMQMDGLDHIKSRIVEKH